MAATVAISTSGGGSLDIGRSVQCLLAAAKAKVKGAGKTTHAADDDEPGEQDE